MATTVSHRLPAVFIGSSTEGIDVAREVELHLQRDAATTIWKDGVFGLGSGTLEALMNALDQFDFAALILSPDDLIESRSQSYASPRDNVLFELGLFMGRLGRSRVFIVHEKDANIKLPSDLAGITLSPYYKRDNLSAALSPTCTPIIKAIRALGFSENRTQQQMQRLENQIQDLEDSQKDILKQVVAFSMAGFIYGHLKNIYFAKREKRPLIYHHIGQTARRELQFLMDMGHITHAKLDELKSGDDLTQKINLTPVGEWYVKLREEMEGRPITGVSQF